VPEGATAALKSDLGRWASPQSIQGVSSPRMAESMVTLGVDMHHLAEACLVKAAPSINVLHHTFGHIGEVQLQEAM